MPISNERAGKKVRQEDLVNVPRLITAYYAESPDVAKAEEKVTFGTSGHRGCSFKKTFNENHILATTQAICDWREKSAISGPLFLGIDTHALSEPAFASCLSVLAANDVEVMIDSDEGYTSTPEISLAILDFNRRNKGVKADGIVITPSHNPPTDGGFKYNPPNGGPADTDITAWVQDRANQYLKDDLKGVKTVPFAAARKQSSTKKFDYAKLYIDELSSVINLDKIKASGIKAAVDPLGGAGLSLWQKLIANFNLPIEVVNNVVDPTFSFMNLDWDGKVRMDCSSPYAMAGLLELKDKYDIAFANDTDHDRHGIVTPKGLMNPNHYLAVAINYLFKNRDGWDQSAAIGKTLVSSSMIDRVAGKMGRRLVEVPVGFKWFVDGLMDGSLGFGGEESAGASFLRKDGKVWTTDKDGVIMALLSAEILAVTGKNPQKHYEELTEEFGEPCYERVDAPATLEEKKKLKGLSAEQVEATELAGDKITRKLTKAPGNDAPIGGLKVETENGWFAARPSGTEDVYKIYAESFKGADHLKQIQQQARELVSEVLASPMAVS